MPRYLSLFLSASVCTHVSVICIRLCACTLIHPSLFHWVFVSVDRSVGHWDDVYVVVICCSGIIMYAMVLGRLPFCTPFRDEFQRQRMLHQIQKGLSASHEQEMQTLTSGQSIQQNGRRRRRPFWRRDDGQNWGCDHDDENDSYCRWMMTAFLEATETKKLYDDNDVA